MILAGDIGGTNCRFAVFDGRGSRLVRVWERTWPSADHGGANDMARAASDESGETITAASFGVAGPVRRGRVHTTNLPWIVDAVELARALGLERVGLLNDLEANAFGLGELGEEDLVTLHAGDPEAQGNRALISAGTGLGEAGLYWDGARHHPFASEGGHAELAPNDESEIPLWRWLNARHGHVSWERVVSGPGLQNIYSYLIASGGFPAPARPWETAAAISSAALGGADPLAARALQMFAGFYGAETGNLALKVLATGGVFVGGGIAPRILPYLKRPEFLAAFFAKGRMRSLMQSMTVRVVMNDKAALLGAARHAANGLA